MAQSPQPVAFPDDVLDLVRNQVDGHLVVAALGDDEVCVSLARQHELQMHRPHHIEILLHHLLF